MSRPWPFNRIFRTSVWAHPVSKTETFPGNFLYLSTLAEYSNCLRNCLHRKQSPACAFPEGKRLSKQSPIHAFSKENAQSKQSLVCAFPKRKRSK